MTIATQTTYRTMADDACRNAGSLLQDQLLEVLDLTLQAKHAHWNVVGPNFRSVHLQLDEITDDLRAWSDLIAERVVTLGVPVSGQHAALAGSGIQPLPDGQSIPAEQAVEAMADRLTICAQDARARAQRLGEIDLVSQNILQDVIQGLEKHIWMLRAQQS